jgi:hypothetical protein
MDTERNADSNCARRMTRRSFRLPVAVMDHLLMASGATGKHVAYVLEDALEAHFERLNGN